LDDLLIVIRCRLPGCGHASRRQSSGEFSHDGGDRVLTVRPKATRHRGLRPTFSSQIDIAIFYGYNCHVKVSVAEAKNKLPKLIKAVEDGESVTIYRHGTPVVDIVRTTKAHTEKPKFGTLKDRVRVLDPDWWKPMTGDDVDAFLDSR
jgi:prevent-host-death family protein